MIAFAASFVLAAVIAFVLHKFGFLAVKPPVIAPPK